MQNKKAELLPPVQGFFTIEERGGMNDEITDHRRSKTTASKDSGS
jgi:hypothetical protein